MADAITFDGLTFPEDGSVIRNLRLTIDTGEKLALFGPNGAGKTSILRTIAGSIRGVHRRPDVAYLPQRPYMFRGSVLHNLTIGGRPEVVAVELARTLGLETVLDHDARALSGGTAQRVALARVLAGSEPLVLLDEPLASVDLADRSLVVDTIRAAMGDRSMIAVTHSVDAAVGLAESLAVVDEGTILQRGPVSHVLSHPGSHRVAEIVGKGNVLVGEVVSSTGSVARVDVGGVELTVVTDVPAGVHVLLRIAPETITVFDTAPSGASNRNVIEGVVDEVRPAGTLFEVVTRDPVELRAVITPGAFDDLAIAPGAAVWLGIKASAIGVVATR